MLLRLADDERNVVVAAMGALSVCRVAATCHVMRDGTRERCRALGRAHSFIRCLLPNSYTVVCGVAVSSWRHSVCLPRHITETYNVLVTGTWRTSTKKWRNRPVWRLFVDSLMLLHENRRFDMQPNGPIPLEVLHGLCPFVHGTPFFDFFRGARVAVALEEHEGCQLVHSGVFLRVVDSYRPLEHIVVTASTSTGTLTMRGNLMIDNLAKPGEGDRFQKTTEIKWTSMAYSLVA